jgi:hypothetical protein
MVFDRTAPEYSSIKLTRDMADVEPQKKNVRNDVLFLSWAAYTNNALAIRIVEWISSKLIIFGFNDQVSVDAKTLFSKFFLDFIKKADNGIVGMKFKSSDLLSSHQLYFQNWDKAKTVEVSFDEYASDGTKRMLKLADTFYRMVKEPVTIVIDELDLHLHPALVRHLIALVNSIAHNPNHAQLICTTHDVLLLDEDIRRDQIWFVDKDGHGVSSLYALSDFKDVRKNSNILKRYLLGVYGAIPDLRGDTNE